MADDGPRYYVWTVPVKGAGDQVIGYQAWITARGLLPTDAQLAIDMALRTVEQIDQSSEWL